MKRLSLFWELTKNDLKEQYPGSIIGKFWNFILPLVNLTIFIVVFSKLMGPRLPGESEIQIYAVYVSVGLLPWIALTKTITRCSTVFVDKRYIISNVRIPLPIFLIYICLSETIIFLVFAFCVSVYLAITGFQFNIYLFLVPFIFYLQQLFALSFGFIAATLTVFFRDLKQLIEVILQFWFWFTPIVYVRDVLPETIQKFIGYNPAFVFIESYQRIFVYNTNPSFRTLISVTILTHLMLFASYIIFVAFEKDVRDCV